MRYLCALLVLATACAAQTVAFPTNAEWTATPGFVRQSSGKYPSTLNVVLYKNDCRDSSGQVQRGLLPLAQGSSYAIVPTGTGVTADPPTVGDCTLTTKLTIDASAQPGLQLLIVNLKPDASNPSTSKGVAVFAMMDPTAGATPGAPQVDVIWDVISKHVCSDSFGNHVPKYLYCIEVKIGNNSSHSLQLAGIGFKIRHPFAGQPNISKDATLISANTAYQTARSMAQAGGDTTFRNLAYRSLEGMGVIMASFTPFFKNTNHKANWSTASAILSGAVVQSFDLIAPDRTIRELANLDDQAFRDGKLIPNNTQVRMIVFVDKELIKGSMKQRCKELFTVQAKTPDGKDTVPDQALLDTCAKSPDDPTIVKILLGDLVVVGDELDYVQRMVVDTSVTSQEVNPGAAAAAAAAALLKTEAPKTAPPVQGTADATTITLTGTSLDTVTDITVDGTKVQFSNPIATKIQVAPLTIKKSPDTYEVTVTFTGGAKTTFKVNAP